MRQTKEQHRGYMREWRAKKKPVETKKESIVEPMPTTEPETDVQVMQGKSDFRAKKKLLIKFVRFDLFKPSNKDECQRIRLSKLGLFNEDKDRLEEHMELCEGCKDWFYNLDNNMLGSSDGEYVYLAYVNDFPTEEEFRETINAINGTVISIDKKLRKITVIGNEISGVWLKGDLSRFQLFSSKEEEKSKQPTKLHPNEIEQDKCQHYEDPEPKPQQSQQPQRKSNNPDPDQWMKDHSG